MVEDRESTWNSGTSPRSCSYFLFLLSKTKLTVKTSVKVKHK